MFFIVLEHLCRRNTRLHLILIENLSKLFVYGFLMVLRVESLDNKRLLRPSRKGIKWLTTSVLGEKYQK